MDLSKFGFVVNTSVFFRDLFVWRTLNKKIVPVLKIVQKEEKKPLNVLVIGCSNGCEAYSIAFLLFEAKIDFVITAIDVSEEQVRKAKKGVYSKKDLENVSKRMLDKFFVKKGKKYKVKKELFKINFESINVIDFFKKDEKKYNLFFCRNVLYYLNNEEKEFVLEKINERKQNYSFFIFGLNDLIPKKHDFFLEFISEKIYTSTYYNNSEQTFIKNNNYKKSEVKIIGVGSAGVNIVNKLPKNKPVLSIDSDICTLVISSENNSWFCVGKSITQGLGTNSIALGKKIFEEDKEKILEFISLKNTKKLILIAGIGGGTGTNGITTILKQAKKHKIKTHAIITKPLKIENKTKTFEKYSKIIKKLAEKTTIIELEKIFKKTKNYQKTFKNADKQIIKKIKTLYFL